MESNKRPYKGYCFVDFLSDYTVVDIETTGLVPGRDEIIEIAAIRYRDGRERESFSSLIRPKKPISPFIECFTGIKSEMVKDSPSIEEVIPSFLDFIGGDALVGFNVHFDVNFLYDACMDSTSRPLTNNAVDVLRIARDVLDTPDHQLSTVAHALKVSTSGAHRAMSDCLITNRCYQAIAPLGKAYYDDKASGILSDMKASGILDQAKAECAGKKIAINGKFKSLANRAIFGVFDGLGASASDALQADTNILFFSKAMYRRFKNLDYEYPDEACLKARELSSSPGLDVRSERSLRSLFGLPVPSSASSTRLSKTIVAVDGLEDEDSPLFGKQCVFTGTLNKMLRRDAMQIVVNIGGTCADSVTKKTDFLIMGNLDYARTVEAGKSSKVKKAEDLMLKGSEIKIISEDVFYDMIDEDSF